MLRHYATFAPAQLLQTSQKRRDFYACLRIALGNLNEHADTPHPPVLLHARRERPNVCRAAVRDVPATADYFLFGPWRACAWSGAAP